jgi:hypothetical protein
MRSKRYNWVAVIGMILTLGLTSAFAGGGKDNKRPKNMGVLSVRTTNVPMPVSVDGQYVGMSGVGVGAEFFLAPGIHTIEVKGPRGEVYKRDLQFEAGRKNCVCLTTIEQTITTPCPYRFHLEGPDRVEEGQDIVFNARNDGTSPVPLIYNWRISNGTIVSGAGTPTITVSSVGFGGKTVEAELDVNDSVYDNKCRQLINAPTDVTPKPTRIEKVGCDQFEARAADDDKARFDNCAIQVQNIPDAELYVIIYPGTDRASTTRNTYDKLSKRTLDYLVKNRGVDPRRIKIFKGSPRLKSSYEIWIVPPGAEPPTVQ